MSQRIYSPEARRAVRDAFFAAKNKQDPEPKVVYWRDDKEFCQQSPFDSDRINKVCPDHGTPYMKTPDSLGVGKMVGCQYCTVLMQYSSSPDYKKIMREATILLAKRGFKGMSVPKDWKVYQAHNEWEDRQAGYAEEYNLKVRASEENLKTSEALMFLQREGKIKYED